MQPYFCPLLRKLKIKEANPAKIAGLMGGYELFDQPEARAKRKGVEEYGFRRNLEYFLVHEDEGNDYQIYCSRQINKYWKDLEFRDNIIDGFSTIFDLQERFYEDLHGFAIKIII